MCVLTVIGVHLRYVCIHVNVNVGVCGGVPLLYRFYVYIYIYIYICRCTFRSAYNVTTIGIHLSFCMHTLQKQEQQLQQQPHANLM